MKFLNIRRIYMDEATGGEGGGGAGGEQPAVQESPAPATLEEKPTEKPVEVPKPKKEEKPVEDTGKLSKVTSLVEQAGLTMKDVATLAKANDGKVDLATMVALTEKHGEAIAELIADQIKSIHTERTNEAKLRDNAVYDQVAEAFKGTTDQSGEETWKELAGWAKENVSTEHRAEINKLLAQGGFAAKLAVQELTTAFKEAQTSVEFQDADLLEADSKPRGSAGLITKQDYNMELNKLLAAGHTYGQSADIDRLDARRTKSIKSGY